jgi:DNA-binding CsgD family transcriptional regulator
MLDEHDTRLETLTTRDRGVLEHVPLGKQNDVIALQLGLTPATVAKHLEHIYRKLAVPNRTAAAALLDFAEDPPAFERRLISVSARAVARCARSPTA